MPKKNRSPIDVFVGQQVRKGRMLAGVSQADVGNELGLTFQQVQKYENGTNRISASKLHAIAGILGRPVEWFFPVAAADGPQFEDITQALGTTRQGVELARAFLAIKDHAMRDAIVSMAMAAAGGRITERKAA